MTSENTEQPKGDDDGNDKVHTDIKPGWDNRPEAYPATKTDGDNIDVPHEALK